MHHRSKILKISAGLIILGLVFFILGFIWLGNGTLTSAKIKVVQVIPYPIAFVNGQALFAGDFVYRLNIARKIIPDYITKEEEIKKSIYQELVNEAKIGSLARSHGVWVSDKETEEELENRQGQENFAGKLKTYGFREDSFKEKVLKPELLAQKLKIWFNSEKGLNTSAYSAAYLILGKIEKGEDMAGLAKEFSQDAEGKALGGDLGFVNPLQILSELREEAAKMKLREVKVLPSRFGLHIIRHEGQDSGQLHLRQVFLKTEDFDFWLERETKNYRVWKLLKI